ncbi:uncharacterized protein LOC141714331 [Apium graveolens]|uniref:uncharacterized protein LOC141714331 n=1 Tax=Apium graveolens TaxID=4045 RepID=UPI003D7A6ADF
MGFDARWIKWMKLCVTSVEYIVSLNGCNIGPIIPSRGLRQGYPLSPYLFILCVEGLSKEIENMAATRRIHGYQISSSALAITHLLFADDNFLFFRATVDEAREIKNLLNLYENMSGQAINYHKSSVFFSSNVRRDKKQEITDILGVANDLSGSHYLGLPSLVGRSKKSVFSFEIERILNGYWWRINASNMRGIRWMAWERMCRSKDRGGLGFRSLGGFNIALLGKHIWNFIRNQNSLVSRVMKARCFPSCHILQARKGDGWSFLWSGIFEAKEELLKGFKWVLGNGESINIFKDPWLRGKQDYYVEDHHSYRHMRIPQNNIPDRVAWVGIKLGSYTAKNGYHCWFDRVNHLTEDELSHGWRRLWRLKIPHKDKYFIWRLCKNNISCCWMLSEVEFDTMLIDDLPKWLLQTLCSSSTEIITSIVTTLWGIWMEINKVVWENKKLEPNIAMSMSNKMVTEWQTTQIRPDIKGPLAN